MIKIVNIEVGSNNCNILSLSLSYRTSAPDLRDREMSSRKGFNGGRAREKSSPLDIVLYFVSR
jgi:hypothetical protein